MKKVMIVTLFVLSIGLLTACNASQPQLVLAATQLELGDVANGIVVERDVVVQNTGDEALVVEGVATSCGCTQATVEPMSIPPGGQGVLHITFDSGAHGPELRGELVRQVFITTNDPKQPNSVVELLANIVAP